MKARAKNLVKKFAYISLIDECPKQGWRLPTLEEAKNSHTEYTCFWIQSKTEIFDDRLHVAYFKDSNSTKFVNKSFMLDAVVMVEPKVCMTCKYFLVNSGGFCLHPTLKEYIYPGTLPSDWGCTYHEKKES